MWTPGDLYKLGMLRSAVLVLPQNGLSQNDSPPPGPFEASLMRLLISEISLIHWCRSSCSISRMSSMSQWKWYAM